MVFRVLQLDQALNDLQTAQALQRPLSELAKILCSALAACPQVMRVECLQWLSQTACYVPLGECGTAAVGTVAMDDKALQQQLNIVPQLAFAEVLRLPCALAAKWAASDAEGFVQLLPLGAEHSLLLLVQLEAGGDAPWLQAWLLLLQRLLQPPAQPLLSADPQPSLLLDAQAQPLLLNPALQRLQAEPPGTALSALVPVNHALLVQACLTQQRPIEAVECQVAERVLLWSYVPDVAANRVLARCVDATAEVLARREAARALRLYRLITENTTDLISRHSLQGDYLDASPASWRLLGLSPETLRGTSVWGLVHPQDVSLLQRAREALVQDGFHTWTFRIRHRDGHYVWLETASRAIRETYTGEVVEVVSVSRNISERVRAEANRRRLAEVVEANTDLVLFIEADGQVVYLNPAARRALKVAPEAAMPNLQTLFDAEDFQRLREQGWAHAQGAGVWSGEARLLPQEAGASLPVSWVLLAHCAAGGERFHSLVARDMTERDLREAQQRRHQDELAHTARLVSLGELASGIAHEINQPLAAVVNYAGASQRYLQGLGSHPQAAERVAQGLERITEQANHASEVIRRLRGFLRKGPRSLQALQPADVAGDAVRLCSWLADSRQVSIEQDFAAGLPPVYADRVLLEQVLLNLLRNAIEANVEAHPQEASRILIGARRQAQQLCIRVEDQGPGATAATRARMFTPFYTSKADGLGLGLSMSRSLIEGFGGSLEAVPGANGGLCMLCCLPLSRDDSGANEVNQ